MAIVVSDTSPIRCLDHIGKLSLLQSLFDEVIIPPSASDQLARPRGHFGPIVVTSLPFVRIQAPGNPNAAALLRGLVDPGEAAAIIVAEELQAELLVDETVGRAEARRRKLQTVGTLGVLLRAKRRGLVPEVMPLAMSIRTGLGFFISDRVLDEVRQLSGEA